VKATSYTVSPHVEPLKKLIVDPPFLKAPISNGKLNVEVLAVFVPLEAQSPLRTEVYDVVEFIIATPRCQVFAEKVFVVVALLVALNLSVFVLSRVICRLVVPDVLLMPMMVRVESSVSGRNQATYVKGGPEMNDVESPLIQELVPLKFAIIVT
jgi:hypothetical protein